MKLSFPDRPGKCRWCGCTEDSACEGGCSWADRRHTVCSECSDFDQAIRSESGRAAVMTLYQNGLLHLAARTVMSAATDQRRKR